jgi:hypothetical protein
VVEVSVLAQHRARLRARKCAEHEFSLLLLWRSSAGADGAPIVEDQHYCAGGRRECRDDGKLRPSSLRSVPDEGQRADRLPLPAGAAQESPPCDDSGRASLSPRRDAAPTFRSCRTHRAKTVLSAPTGRVFWEPRWDDSDGWTTVAFACLFSVNKRFKLGQDEDDDSDLGPFRLVGPYVAYHGAYCPMGCGFDLTVLDLRDGRRVREVPGASPGSIGRVKDLELHQNGSIAWISTAPPYSSERTPSVSSYDTFGRRRLDTSNIALDSLELSGSTLSWAMDGVAYSATLD